MGGWQRLYSLVNFFYFLFREKDREKVIEYLEITERSQDTGWDCIFFLGARVLCDP